MEKSDMGSLKVIGLEKSYGIRTLFSNVNFEVMHGDKIGLVGANGSGKTTLMRILLGREESDGGRVVMDFADTVGYVEQQADFSGDTLYDELRGAFSDIIALGDEKGRMEQHIASGRADAAEMAAYGNLVTRFEAMDGYDFESRIRRVAFGLGFSEADLMKDVRHFSGGQTTRICLAKALLREPDFLFLDEPTNHLDIRYQLEIMENIRQMNLTVIAAIHDLNVAASYCDRIIAMKDGMILREGTPEEIFTDEFIYELYGVRARIHRFGDGNIVISYHL
jgi:ABC superfamily ATP binding cassette transporter, ABC protein